MKPVKAGMRVRFKGVTLLGSVGPGPATVTRVFDEFGDGDPTLILRMDSGQEVTCCRHEVSVMRSQEPA